mgnify:CR=1 FL=1
MDSSPMIASMVPISPTLYPAFSRMDFTIYVVVVFLCSGNSDRFQFLRRMSKICSGNKGHRITGICNFDHSYLFRCFYLFFNNECFRTFPDHIRYKFVSIHNRTANADKQGIFSTFRESYTTVETFLFCAAPDNRYISNLPIMLILSYCPPLPRDIYSITE